MNDDVKRIEKLLDPSQRHFAQAMATLRVENRMLKRRSEALEHEHKQLWRILVTVLSMLREAGQRELRIHATQFKRLEDFWRIERRWDRETEEVVVALKHITDSDDGGKRGEGGSEAGEPNGLH